jgi:hypothetical protein
MKANSSSVHLYQGMDGMDCADTWCGKLEPAFAEEVSRATCGDCLDAAAEFAREVLSRIQQIESEKQIRTEGLSNLETRALNFIRAYTSANSEAPTYAEIARHVGLNSSASIHGLLRRLEVRNLIYVVPRVSRGIRLKSLS